MLARRLKNDIILLKMTNKFRKVLLLACRICLWILAILFGVRCIIDDSYTKYGGAISGLILPFVPMIMKRLFKIKHIAFRIELLYYIFVFIALDLGICFDLYVGWADFIFDKVVHFLSGVGTSIVGYYALNYYKTERTPKFFRGLFIVFFSISIATLWEFFEFSCDKILGFHMQTLVTSGVDDTMWDLIAATIGSVIGAWLWSKPFYKRFIEG